MQIPQSELSYWSEDESQWVLENGTYSFNLGNSSRTLPFNIDIEIK
ncbi:fibronectin type III-like domain-contianing protein [Flavobacteriaceae bacterium]|nr:fibronectin type III-like domain-contianing protein [Flavobacteriaceae bacterium]